MAFFDELSKILKTATSLLPLVAMTNPNSAAGVASAGAVIAIVKPLVDSIEQISNSQGKLTGEQKLQMAMAAVQQSHAMAQSQGMTNSTFEQYWAVVNPAITAICAQSKVQA